MKQSLETNADREFKGYKKLLQVMRDDHIIN